MLHKGQRISVQDTHKDMPAGHANGFLESFCGIIYEFQSIDQCNCIKGVVFIRKIFRMPMIYRHTAWQAASSELPHGRRRLQAGCLMALLTNPFEEMSGTAPHF
ncbi:hypothetical protein DAMNIGENAA_00450 [Desulforhabdus amnigena]|uniref:Uncharacterized protein n=1 Tax=Desulforhabdus amnigena TaxID=40218 RepID=A0A9W6FQL6_9BACT|nr:hypothetical protein DAMNIGENAA_00450 [Desulforhabdus amnigena]